MIEALVVLLVLGAATVVFYPALAGTTSARRKSRAVPAAVEVDAELAEHFAGLTERKNRLLRNLAELDTERAAGRLAESDYADLKRRDEIEAARAIRELEALQAEPKSAKRKSRGGTARPPAFAEAGHPRIGITLAWLGGAAAFAVILGLTMSRSVAPREEGGTITGTIPGAGAPSGGGPASPIFPRTNPARLAELAKTIKRDSTNLKALLEAGHLYLAEQRLDEAAAVTIKALSLDPESPEAHAHIGVLLMAEGSSQQDPDSARRSIDGALAAVNHAIQAQPDLAEAWLFKGMILMAGRQDVKGAAQAWEQYLKVAPPDADTTRIHAMVEGLRHARQR